MHPWRVGNESATFPLRGARFPYTEAIREKELLMAETANATSSPSNKATQVEPVVVIPEVLPIEGETTLGQKAKGVAQMAAGSVLTAAGVPLLVLPGPGVAAIAGGGALISKGDRNFTGRKAVPIEEKLDEVAARSAEAAKNAAGKTAKNVAAGAAVAVPKAAERVAHGAATVARSAKPVARKAAHLAAGGALTAVRAGGHLARKGTAAIRSKRK